MNTLASAKRKLNKMASGPLNLGANLTRVDVFLGKRDTTFVEESEIHNFETSNRPLERSEVIVLNVRRVTPGEYTLKVNYKSFIKKRIGDTYGPPMWHKKSSKPYIFRNINEYIYVNPRKIVGKNTKTRKLLSLTISFTNESDKNRNVEFPIYKSFDSVKYREDTYEPSALSRVYNTVTSLFKSKEDINKALQKAFVDEFKNTYFKGGEKQIGMVPQTWLDVLNTLRKYAQETIIENAKAIISSIPGASKVPYVGPAIAPAPLPPMPPVVAPRPADVVRTFITPVFFAEEHDGSNPVFRQIEASATEVNTILANAKTAVSKNWSLLAYNSAMNGRATYESEVQQAKADIVNAYSQAMLIKAYVGQHRGSVFLEGNVVYVVCHRNMTVLINSLEYVRSNGRRSAVRTRDVLKWKQPSGTGLQQCGQRFYMSNDTTSTIKVQIVMRHGDNQQEFGWFNASSTDRNAIKTITVKRYETNEQFAVLPPLCDLMLPLEYGKIALLLREKAVFSFHLLQKFYIRVQIFRRNKRDVSLADSIEDLSRRRFGNDIALQQFINAEFKNLLDISGGSLVLRDHVPKQFENRIFMLQRKLTPNVTALASTALATTFAPVTLNGAPSRPVRLPPRPIIAAAISKPKLTLMAAPKQQGEIRFHANFDFSVLHGISISTAAKMVAETSVKNGFAPIETHHFHRDHANKLYEIPITVARDVEIVESESEGESESESESESGSESEDKTELPPPPPMEPIMAAPPAPSMARRSARIAARRKRIPSTMMRTPVQQKVMPARRRIPSTRIQTPAKIAPQERAESVESVSLSSINNSAFENESVESLSLSSISGSKFEAESVESMSFSEFSESRFENESVESAVVRTVRPSTPETMETPEQIHAAAEKLKALTAEWKDDEKAMATAPPSPTAKPVRVRPMRKTMLSKEDEKKVNEFLDRRDQNVETLRAMSIYSTIDSEEESSLTSRLLKLRMNTPENYEELMKLEGKIFKIAHASLKQDVSYAKMMNDESHAAEVDLACNTTLDCAMKFATQYLHVLQRGTSYTRTSKIEKLCNHIVRQKMRLERILKRKEDDDAATVESEAYSVDSEPRPVADADVASMDSSLASLNIRDIPEAKFETESISQVSVTLDDIPKGMFEEESAESVVNSVISSSGDDDRVVGRIKHMGTELPATEADLNLTALVNDKNYWETCSEESGFSVPDFDLCEEDDDDDWD